MFFEINIKMYMFWRGSIPTILNVVPKPTIDENLQHGNTYAFLSVKS